MYSGVELEIMGRSSMQDVSFFQRPGRMSILDSSRTSGQDLLGGLLGRRHLCEADRHVNKAMVGQAAGSSQAPEAKVSKRRQA